MILIIAAIVFAFTSWGAKPAEDDSWMDEEPLRTEWAEAVGEVLFTGLEPDSQRLICEMVLSGPDGYDTVVDVLVGALHRADAEAVAAYAVGNC